MEQQRKTIYRRQGGGQVRPSGGAPAPARRPKRPPRRRNPLLPLLCLGALALAICLAVWLLGRGGGPDGPAVPDYGTVAEAWQQNELGYYYNDQGEVIPGAVLKGIDVSRYQGEVNWETAKAAGVDFAIIRCGFGGEWDGQEEDWAQDDPQWRRNADECTRLGIPFGAYLYSYATTVEEARSEADHVARLLGLVAPAHEGLEDYTAAPYNLTYPVYYDLEDKYITGVLPDEMAELTAAFFERLESYGYTGRQGLYASLNWVRARFDDPGFDRWRDELWIARFNSELGYTGPYSIWQCSYTAPGADYGVQSETVDINFVMKSLTITGITDASGKQAAPSFTNDTYKNELWLGQKKDRATLVTDHPAEVDGGQKIFWASSDTSVATVDKNGTVKAVGEGQCTVTATLADGTESADVTVRVGSVTVPVFATAALAGQVDNGSLSLADVAALKATYPDAILLDAGGSLHGTDAASLTGGMDMTSAFSSAGYDLQVFDARDLAFGSERLLTDAGAAAGPSLAANLRGEDGAPLFYRSTSWNRNRVSNGMNYTVREAGKVIGFFALADPDAVNNRVVTPRETALTANDALQTASEQVAALNAKGADAIICILGPDFGLDDDTLQEGLAQLGVTAVIDGGLAQDGAPAGGVPVLAAATGLERVGRLDLVFTAEGGVEVSVSSVSANALQTARESLTGDALDAYDRADAALTELVISDGTVYNQVLFTYAPNPDTDKTISFGNYVAQLYADLAAADQANWGEAWAGVTPTALVGYTAEPVQGQLTRGDLQSSLPGGEHRIVLVQTTGEAVGRLIEGGTVTRTYLDSLTAYTPAEGAALLITDTLALQNLDAADYTVLRDYGDVYWNVRMAINDATNNFNEAFYLPEAPTLGVGRGS